MSAAPRIFTIPPDVPFLPALAEGLWEQAQGDPLALARHRILLPTRRACRALREAFLEATGGKATLLPRLQPLGDVDEAEFAFSGMEAPETLDLPPAFAPLRRQLLLTRLVRQKDPALPLDQTARLAAALADLLDQMQTERRDPAGLAHLVPQESLATHWQETLAFLSIVTREWPRVREEEGALDPALRRNRVLEAQAAAWRAAPPPFPVIAAGSTGSVPAVAELMACVARLPQGAVVLPGLDQGLDEEAWQEAEESHPQYGLKKWLEHAEAERKNVALWPCASTRTPSPRAARTRLVQESLRPASLTQDWLERIPRLVPREAALAGLERLDLDHAQEEAEVIALRLRAALEEPGQTAALVTPDRALAARVVAALRRWGIEANDSAGTSLALRPLGVFLRDVLRAASPRATPVDYLALLKHPLAAGGRTPAACRTLARRAERLLWRGLARARSLAGACAALEAREQEKELTGWFRFLEKAFQPLLAAWRTTAPLDEHRRRHIALAEALAATPEEDGAARLWQGDDGEEAAVWLNELGRAADGFPPLTGQAYAELFEGLLRDVAIRASWGLHPRLRVLGTLEARLQSADFVVLGGLNETVWPPAAAVDPWMSRPMKKAFGLPTPERRIGLAAHDFAQLACAPRVLLTRARRLGTTPTVPSRFLLQLDAALQTLGASGDAAPTLAPAEPWADWARALVAPASVTPCAPPAPSPPVEAFPRRLSVTRVGLWQRNPYAIYARYILGLKKLDELDADFTASDRGTMIHEALEAFLKRDVQDPDAARTALLACGREAFAPYADRPEVEAFWWPRFERLAARFTQDDAARRAEGCRPLATEAEGTFVLPDGGFTLEGRADRLDLRPDGTLDIIDYKTGAAPSAAEVRAGIEPQMPLLALIAESGGFAGVDPRPVGGMIHWRVTGGNAAKEGPEPIKTPAAELVAKAREGLIRLVAAFRQPGAVWPALPRPRFAPRYDDYAHLARAAEWSRTEEDS